MRYPAVQMENRNIGREREVYFTVNFAASAKKIFFQKTLVLSFPAAVGNAFAVLSDPEKKKQYDLYGPEESNATSQHRSAYGHHDFTRGYESKF